VRDKPGGAAAAIATWFGCGYSPKAPGTAGSLGALAPAVLLAQYGGFRPWHFAVLAAAVTPAAIWAAGRVARAWGEKDPSQVVVDEVVGQWVALAGAATLDWKSWLAAFVLFRFFDIWKPFPVRRLEALPGGLGIVADDLAAGVYGALVLFAAGCFNFY
jgi:phosphatidylglycerophosphatase A